MALCALGALAVAGALEAQTQRAAGRYVVIGCVSAPATTAAVSDATAGPSRFVITDTRGDKPAVYRLQGDASKLKVHVGHTLEITGSLSAAPAGTGDPIAGAPVLDVQKIVWIAATCRDRKKD